MNWRHAGSFAVALAGIVAACSSGEVAIDEDVTPPLPVTPAVGEEGGSVGSTRPQSQAGECSKDADCVVPPTTPANCAEGICDVVLQRCTWRAKDADGDGRRASTCALTGSTESLPVGDDCDDGDATTYPGAPDVCDGKEHTCNAPPSDCGCAAGTTRPCGNAATCNASAIQTCSAEGKWQACTPAPINTCAPSTSYACSTCSTIGLATNGKRTCTASCDFNGVRCVPDAVTNPLRVYAGNVFFSHERGAATSPGNPNSHWESPAGEAAGYVLFGPYRVLPAGRYRVMFSFYGAPGSSDAVLDVSRGGQCGGALGGLCGVTVNPSGNGETKNYAYNFTIGQDCQPSWEIRVQKTGTGRLYVYSVDLYYDGP